MAEPLTLAIASAVVGKVAEAATEQGRQAFSAIVAKIRGRLRDRPAAIAVLDAAASGEREPEALAVLLDREFAADPAFGEEIRSLWLRLAPAATDDAVSNVFSGKAGKVIQLRDVYGDLNIS